MLGVSRFYEGKELRLSYVTWQEKAQPYLVVELLSPGTEKEDMGNTTSNIDSPPTKWTVYEQILRIPYYVVFSRYTDELHYYQLQGDHYHEVTSKNQRLWITGAGLGLGLWYGVYEGLQRNWLRFYDAEGVWIPTPLEKERQQTKKEHDKVSQARQQAEQERQRAEQEHLRAEQERQRAEQEHLRAEQLAEQLRALGIQPEKKI